MFEKLSICILAAALAPAVFAKDPTYKYDPAWPKQLPNNWISSPSRVCSSIQTTTSGC